jgi:hypothetical protein
MATLNIDPEAHVEVSHDPAEGSDGLTTWTRPVDDGSGPISVEEALAGAIDHWSAEGGDQITLQPGDSVTIAVFQIPAGR